MGGEWEEAVGGVGRERGGERRKEERVRRKEGGREIGERGKRIWEEEGRGLVGLEDGKQTMLCRYVKCRKKDGECA